jgi:hypothetical protein
MWKEGLPRIIASGGIMQMNLLFQAFPYITGWIGWTKICNTQVQQKIHLKMKLLSMYL